MLKETASERDSWTRGRIAHSGLDPDSQSLPVLPSPYKKESIPRVSPEDVLCIVCRLAGRLCGKVTEPLIAGGLW